MSIKDGGRDETRCKAQRNIYFCSWYLLSPRFYSSCFTLSIVPCPACLIERTSLEIDKEKSNISLFTSLASRVSSTKYSMADFSRDQVQYVLWNLNRFYPAFPLSNVVLLESSDTGEHGHLVWCICWKALPNATRNLGLDIFPGDDKIVGKFGCRGKK